MKHAISSGFRPLQALGHFIQSIGSTVWVGLIMIAEARPQMAQIRRLNEMSDEDLAAQGLTRVQAVEQIFGNRCL